MTDGQLSSPSPLGSPTRPPRPSTGDHGRDTFRWLHDDHADALLAYAERFTHDRMAAEDAVQETFLRAWSNLPRVLADEPCPRPWLRTVLRHQLIDAARASRSRTSRQVRNAFLDTGTDGGFDAVLDRDLLATAMQRLSTRHRDVVVGTYFRDLPAERLAIILGVPVGTVRSRLHYALNAIRSQLTYATGTAGPDPKGDVTSLSRRAVGAPARDHDVATYAGGHAGCVGSATTRGAPGRGAVFLGGRLHGGPAPVPSSCPSWSS